MGESKIFFFEIIFVFSPKEFRPINMELGVLPHVEGSCRLKAGEVDILVGVRAELETVLDSDASALDKPLRLEFSVELNSNADSRFLAKEPTDLVEQIKNALKQAYDNDECLPQLNKYVVNFSLSSTKSGCS